MQAPDRIKEAMKGLIVDCKKGDTKEMDDGLPGPAVLPFPELQGLDLAQTAQKLKELDELIRRHQ